MPRHVLILTGALRPGFDAASVWSDIAAYLRIDLARLHTDVRARAPVIIKEEPERARLESLRGEIERRGAEAEIHAAEGSERLFVLIDNVPRGPVVPAFVAEQVRRGLLPADVRVAVVGTQTWTAFVAPSPAPPPAPDTGTVPAVFALDAGTGTHMQSEALPAGAAIHAGFWRRVAAYLIDSLILWLPSVIIGIVPLLGWIAVMVGRWLYFALMESSPQQATLGKLAMGIKATDDCGNRLDFGRATGRYFAGALSTLILYIGYALVGWTARKQGLHDLVAGTCVVFREVEPGRPLPTVRRPMPWYGWLVNILLMLLIPGAILAAIALPAYQDYLTRAKVATAVASVAPHKIDVAEAIARGDACPQGRREGTDAQVASVVFAGDAPACSFTMTFAGVAAVPASLRGETIEWTYRGDGDWTCMTTLPGRLAPRECR
ncbi:MAG TPA: RDD family protein [Dokdonella sp.]|uniref:RDD family protein n=1 Tax=Dokdonella sp. TaxID=2291710 RepID=UPI0025C157F7|nr:RDD family protein [Dokdonella sp.]MBX3691388.1 RDD family protein [Dokdonella sp.]MCW5566744.1 RDD family protein [Dokdonella sp.]HNR91151.1 RDD family protein [Dokdonella sp.]